MQSANYNSPVTVQGNSSGEALPMQGAAADGATAAGNPVQIGGVDGSGNAQALSASINGVLVLANTQSGSDGVSNTSTLGTLATAAGGNMRLGTMPMDFNGTTYDRVRNNTDLTVLTSAARTATNQSADIVNYNGKGLHLVIDVTAASATPSVVFTIQGKDALSGKYYTILASAAVTGISTTVLRVHPGITVAANLSASDLLPRTWRVDATHADADSITYSVGASVIL